MPSERAATLAVAALRSHLRWKWVAPCHSGSTVISIESSMHTTSRLRLCSSALAITSSVAWTATSTPRLGFERRVLGSPALTEIIENVCGEREFPSGTESSDFRFSED